jgi:DEAD/DEAH box helicase domain-containing protein
MNRLTGKVASIDEMIALVKSTPELMSQVTHWHTIPPRDPIYDAFPTELHPILISALKAKGIDKLYTHQAQSFLEAMQGHNVVTVTPTASGKTLCYNLPVLQEILNNDNARALYLIKYPNCRKPSIEWGQILKPTPMMVIHLQRLGKRFVTRGISL